MHELNNSLVFNVDLLCGSWVTPTQTLRTVTRNQIGLTNHHFSASVIWKLFYFHFVALSRTLDSQSQSL